MQVLTGQIFTDLIKDEGTEAAFQALKANFDVGIGRNIISYLKFKRCPEPYYCGEDVRQLTWNAVFIDIEKYRRGEKQEDYVNPAGWLFKIQRRFCIKDILKHIRERNNISLEEYDNPDFIDERYSIIHPFNSLVESQFYRREQLSCVRRYILTLPEPQITAFELFINDFTHKEIAFFLDIAPELSRQWISRAVRKIKQKISKL